MFVCACGVPVSLILDISRVEVFVSCSLSGSMDHEACSYQQIINFLRKI